MTEILKLLEEFKNFTSEQVILIFTFILSGFGVFVKFLLSDSGKKFIGIDIESNKQIVEKLHKFETDLAQLVSHIKNYSTDSISSIKELHNELCSLKKDLESVSEKLTRELERAQEDVEASDRKNEKSIEHVSEMLNDTYETTKKLAANLERMDDLIRMNFPDFKEGMKDLGREMDTIKDDVRRLEGFLANRMTSTQNYRIRV